MARSNPEGMNLQIAEENIVPSPPPRRPPPPELPPRSVSQLPAAAPAAVPEPAAASAPPPLPPRDLPRPVTSEPYINPGRVTFSLVFNKLTDNIDVKKKAVDEAKKKIDDVDATIYDLKQKLKNTTRPEKKRLYNEILIRNNRYKEILIENLASADDDLNKTIEVSMGVARRYNDMPTTLETYINRGPLTGSFGGGKRRKRKSHRRKSHKHKSKKRKTHKRKRTRRRH